MNKKNPLFIIALALLLASLVININNFYFQQSPSQPLISSPKKSTDVKVAEKAEEIETTKEPVKIDDSPQPQIAGIVDSKQEIPPQPSTSSPDSKAENKQEPSDNFDWYYVQRVIDGDTIELTTGETVRYIGIDTPESVHPDKAVMCYGLESAQINRQLIEGKNVRLQKDISEKDKYDRLLRYVYLEDGTFINLYLVQNGYATSYSYPPDLKYQDLFREAELEARNTNIGLWAACLDDHAPTTSPQASMSDSCQIKGNISSKGEKIYHLPGQKYYNKTVIDLSKGERWFCSEQEAQSAGWRKSKI